MLWRTFNIKNAVKNNYFRYFFFIVKGYNNENNLLDYLIKYDVIHNLINLFFWGPFSQIRKKIAFIFPQKTG